MSDNTILLSGNERDAYIAKHFNNFERVPDQVEVTAPHSDDSMTDATWYDNLTAQDQELYDMIEDMCPEFTKLSGEKCQEFLDILADYGIKTSDDFESAYFTQFSYAYDESHYGELVEYCVTEINCQELPEYLVIDWQASWYRNYRHDFIDIEFDGEVYFFFANF